MLGRIGHPVIVVNLADTPTGEALDNGA